jgi:arylsulfatase A-like enzyme
VTVAAILFIGVVTGAADALCVYADLFDARRGKAYVPPTMLPVAILLVSFFCLCAAAPLLWRATRRLSVIAAIYAGPAVVFFLRARPDSGGRRFVAFVAACFVVVALAALLLLRLRSVQQLLHHASPLLIGTMILLSIIVIVSRLTPPAWKKTPEITSRRNVILIFLDAVRADSLSAELTPNMMRFANRGARFTRAFAASSWTLPSHLSVVTGVPPTELGVDAVDQSIGSQFTTLAERFRSDGYRTAAILANWFPNHGTGMQRGYDTMQYPLSRLDFERTAHVVLAERTLRYVDMWLWWDAEEVNTRARRFMNGGGTYFLTLNYMDAHSPFYAVRGCNAPAVGNAHSPDAYRRAVRCLDQSIGRLLDDVENDVASGRTIVAIVSDHGEQFGEHGLRHHGNSLYAQLVHVPMILRGAWPPAVVDQPVSLTGLYGALLAASRTGREAHALAALREVSVVSFLRQPPPPRGPSLESWSIVKGDHHLIIDSAGGIRLFNIAVDPHETRNLAGRPEFADFEFGLAAQLAPHRARTLPERRDSRFKGLGYLQ